MRLHLYAQTVWFFGIYICLSSTVSFACPNQIPIAMMYPSNAWGAYAVCVGDSLYFYDDGSYDPDDGDEGTQEGREAIELYKIYHKAPSGSWTEKYSGELPPSGVEISFSEAGTHGVKIRVWDNDDLTPSIDPTLEDTLAYCTVVVIGDVTITTPYGDPTTSPGANSTNEVSFDTLSPGECEITCTATPNPDTADIRSYLNNYRVRWTIEPISGSTLSWDSAWPGDSTKGEGLSCTATFTGLPSDNGEFGVKEVKMEVLADGYTVDITDTTDIEVFFHPFMFNNPYGATLNNWYYYWRVGDVVSDLLYTSFDSTIYTDDLGYYDTFWDLCYVYWTAGGTDSYDETVYNQYYQIAINTGADGIAGSNTTVEDDVFVLGGVGQGKPDQAAITAGPNAVLDTTPLGDDAAVGTTITTGSNGVCNTTASGDDVQVIPVGQGAPDSIMITAGSDGFLHPDQYTLSGDDEFDYTNQISCHLESDYDGIDLCASVCAHELMHQTTFGYGEDDDDEDSLDDSYEGCAPYYLDPTRKDTYDIAGTFDPGYASSGDWEFLSRLEDANPGETDPSKDWSAGGRQWDQ